MCGIVAVIRRPSRRTPPELDPLVAALRAAAPVLPIDVEDARTSARALGDFAARVEAVDRPLRGVPGVRGLLSDPSGRADLAAAADELQDSVDRLDQALDASTTLVGDELESVNAALVRAKDAVWAITHDRIRHADAVALLAGSDPTPGTIEACASIQTVLSSIDRLEVRGRDSAGIHVMVRGHGLDLEDPAVAAMLGGRDADPLFANGSVRVVGDAMSFVYKAAAEIGELGDNTARLRAAMTRDELLHRALASEGAEAVVLAHTRWASIGVISEANAHPLNQEEIGRVEGPYVVAALNGDVDNFADLIALEQLRIPVGITTDAKVIPALMSHRLQRGEAPLDAFRSTVAGFEGSVAVAANTPADPHKLFLALRGSGQGVFVGLAEDAFIVASEPYGVVEETATYIRLDGETPGNPDNPGGSQGQILVLDDRLAGELAGLQRIAYDGTDLPLREADLNSAEVTTRDIDRGAFPHFLMKELSEAPGSFRKTLRGKVVERDGVLSVALGDATLSPDIRERLQSGAIRRVLVIGQGTAAVAGQSLAAALVSMVPDNTIRAEAVLATELSGFHLNDAMEDTLVVAISQSGTTTDTNRTVDVVRAHGAAVVSIVNRRNSDLASKSDGVLYTSDGRDVEMSVASTKAFYAQIAAGFLLAAAIAAEVAPETVGEHDSLLRALRSLPAALTEVLARRGHIAGVAQRHAPNRRSWAIAGNGVNRIAAQEVRIKLSELCYKAIACDVTEDKKHIDLSSEPLIFVCAAGLRGSNADDVGKELAIYRAHKAAPIAVVDENDDRFSAALETIPVPSVDPRVAFVLSAMAGHLFGYEAALAIDASARPLREARSAIDDVVRRSPSEVEIMARLAIEMEPLARRYFDELRAGTYDGALDAGTAVRIATVIRYALGIVPLDAYAVELGAIGTPGAVVEDLTAALTKGIEELTRPVDAIKHQAKTVTVGISRSDETLLRVPLVRDLLAAGVSRDSLSYRTLRTLVDLDPAVLEVVGYTRYRIDGDPAVEPARVHVVDKGGVAIDIVSRTERDATLRGTKHRAAVEREVTVTVGASDGRTLVIVPEVKANHTVGLSLLHVRMPGALPADIARSVLQGYRGRYTALQDAVTETEPAFDDDVLARVPLVELLTKPVLFLAEYWRPAA
ncbi:MAG: glucosamine 6-phosphate synthetase, contains amidotransferase and phosphosugar isomerase domain [Actinomycetia bacterium]|nr:glucosamine 6-phosphate synthetase, contains amidotransferase and phosphosugar isomerase domain [Actinomycetes bacterium]